MANPLIGIMAVLGGGAILLTQAAKRDEQTKPPAKRKGSSGKATSKAKGSKAKGSKGKGSKAKGSKGKGSKKRALSPYNRFVGQRLPQLKAQGYSPAKAMKVAAAEWRVKQGR